MLQSYFLLPSRNLCSGSLSVMFVLENPATKDIHAWAKLGSFGTWDLANTVSHRFQTFRESLKHRWAKCYSTFDKWKRLISSGVRKKRGGSAGWLFWAWRWCLMHGLICCLPHFQATHHGNLRQLKFIGFGQFWSCWNRSFIQQDQNLALR